MDEITIQFLKMGETLNKVLENQMSMKEEILKIQKDLIDFKVETRENFAKHLKRMDDGFFTVQQLFKADSDGIRGFEKVNFS